VKVLSINRSLFLLAMTAMLSAALASTGCKKRGDAQVDKPAAPTSAPANANLVPAKKPDGSQFKLAFVPNNTSDFWKQAQAGVRKYEKEAGVKVDFRPPSDGTTPTEQNTILDNFDSQDYDAIGVSAIAPDAQVEVLNRIAKKAKLISFDSDAPKSTRLLYIGTRNYEAGKLLGQEIVKLLPNGGKIAVFVGFFSADNAAQRLKGIEDAIQGKNITIVDKREDQTDRTKARSNVEDVITANADLKMVVGLWEYNGPAIAAALAASGKKGVIKAAVFDGPDATLDAVQEGTIDAALVQKPFEIGYQTAKWLHALAAGGDAAAKIPTDKSIDTGAMIVNKENLQKYKSDVKEMVK
jgi:ribose transport system substrate-binding protein